MSRRQHAESQTEKRNRPPSQQFRLYAALAVSNFQRFTRTEAFSGILLILCAIVATLWANSAWGDSYQSLIHRDFSIGFGSFLLSKTLIHWINDGLMVIFFFVVGLEIKRELLIGELSSPRKALLPALTAVGGMLVPAALYLAFNQGGEGANGWGIPMATDIAFALGILMLAGKNVPMSLKVFLTALAIVDDLGAVLVIALFYTADVQTVYLYNGLALYGLMILLNVAGMRVTIIYSALGIVLWFLFLKSGVHATIAGVLLAFVIPAEKTLNYRQFYSELGSLTRYFGETFRLAPNQSPATGRQARMLLLEEIYSAVHRVHSPLERLEHGLKPWTAYLILPIFALANGGVTFGSDLLASLSHPVFWGIFLGLFIGKQVGVFGFGWLAIRLRWASMPTGVSWLMLYGVSILGGIGFTMSLFISELGLPPELQQVSKLGIMAATFTAAVTGFILTKRGVALMPEDPDAEMTPEDLIHELKQLERVAPSRV
jgi:NhaA family Na+:H+ antiporter